MAAGTVRKAMDQVAEVFEANARPHLFKSTREKVDFEVSMLMNGYKNRDPPEKHEVDATPFFLRECYNRAGTKKERKVSILLIIAIFMRCAPASI